MIKGKLYTPQQNLEILKVHRISKSQAWQRTGRAGRESPGTCYRLYTEAEFESLPDNTVPEILRSNLSSVSLQLIALGIHDLVNFDFMSAPDVESIMMALSELELIGAVKKRQSSPESLQNGHKEEVNGFESKKKVSNLYDLTEMGRKMAQFPLDPKLSRCILAAEKLNCVDDILKIVSLLSVENIFHNTGNIANAAKREQAKAIRQKFVSSDGDHITLLNVYKAFVTANKSSLGGKEWCSENYLDFKNLKLAVDICKQLRDVCARNDVKVNSNGPTDTVNIRLALVNGMFMNTAEHFKDNEYKTVI
jgi:ATP-dependent RNA helicase DHX33